MEIKLDSLIEKIKKDGVEEAERQAEQIVTSAHDKAKVIVDRADQEASEIVKAAKRQSLLFKNNTEEALRQAARDIELLLKEKIIALFDRIFKNEISDAMTPDLIRAIILKIVERWSPDSKIEIVLSEKDRENLQVLLFSAINNELQNSIVFKTHPDNVSGFRIGIDGENVHYDFTDESFAEAISSYLNTELREIIDLKNG